MFEQNQSAKLWTTSFISLTLCSLLLFLNLQMLLSSFPAYVKEEFQAGDLMVSLVTSLFALSAIVTRFLTAALMRRMSRGTLLYAGLIIAGAVTSVYLLADSMGSLLVMRVLYGIGFGMASTIIPTLVSQIIPGNRMGEGIGYFGLSTSLAMSIGPVIGMNIMNEFGFGPLTITGAIVVLLAVPLLFATKSIPPEKKPPAKVQHTGTPAAPAEPAAKRAVIYSQLILPALLNMIVAITYSGLLSFIVLFGKSVHLEQVGLFFLFNVITIVIIRPISGRIFDSRGHGAVLIPAAISIVASMTILSFTTTMPTLILSALLYGLGFGAIQPTLQAWMLRSCSTEQHGTANGMYYNSTDLGVAAGAIILGAISSATSYATMYLYSAGVMVLFLAAYLLGRMLVARQQQAAGQVTEHSGV
ncbi:MFS transporter [Paenibacillus sp. GCM10027626]|uniref:MFS transporter n=1 Tax=Paenibacillus sp. GCM10027626 TaxID=3273411 RepID=UPI00364006CF